MCKQTLEFCEFSELENENNNRNIIATGYLMLFFISKYNYMKNKEKYLIMK